MFRLSRLSLLVCVALAGPPAISQAAETSAENAQASVPALVVDPLLAPAPRATTEVASWQEARALLESQATDLQAAVAAVARAEARSRQALAGVLPSARLQGGVGFDVVNPQVPALGIVGAGGAAIAVAAGRAGTPTQPVAGMALTGTVPVVDIASWMNIGSAEAGVHSASFTEADVRRRLVQSLSRLLVSVVAAERAADLNRGGLRLALERAALTTRLEQLGAAVSLDVVRIQQDVEVARTALLGGDEQLFRAREALAQLLGLEGQAGVATTFDVRGLVDDVGGTCSVVARNERDDVAAAHEAAQQARGSRDQTVWGYAPRLDLTTSAAALTTTTGPVLGTWSIGAVVSLPLWEGGNREGVVDERNAAIAQAEASVEAARRTVDVEVDRAGRYEGTARALYETARRSRDLAARADQLTRRSFEIGRVGSLELVQTANVLRQAELVLAAREFDWAQARLDSFLTTARCAP
jgi:outer membrane protein TolC